MMTAPKTLRSVDQLMAFLERQQADLLRNLRTILLMDAPQDGCRLDPDQIETFLQEYRDDWERSGRTYARQQWTQFFAAHCQTGSRG